MNWILICFFVGFLCWISITDVRKQIIPDKAIGIAILVRAIYQLVMDGLVWKGWLILFLNGLIVALPVLIFVLLMEKIRNQELMGGGDIKLLFVIGMYIGWEKALVAFLLACVAGIIVGVIWTKKENAYFPFGPWIALGTVISMLIS